MYLTGMRTLVRLIAYPEKVFDMNLKKLLMTNHKLIEKITGLRTSVRP